MNLDTATAARAYALTLAPTILVSYAAMEMLPAWREQIVFIFVFLLYPLIFKAMYERTDAADRFVCTSADKSGIVCVMDAALKQILSDTRTSRGEPWWRALNHMQQISRAYIAKGAVAVELQDGRKKEQ